MELAEDCVVKVEGESGNTAISIESVSQSDQETKQDFLKRKESWTRRRLCGVRAPKIVLVGVIFLMVAMSFGLFALVWEEQKDSSEDNFHSSALVMDLALSYQWNLVIILQEAVRQLVLAFQPELVSSGTYVNFTKPIQQFLEKLNTGNSQVQCWQFVPRVWQNEREEVERRVGEDLQIENFTFTELLPDSLQLRPRTIQPYYFPIIYLEPLEGNLPAAGLDLSQEVSRRHGLTTAVSTGEPTTTDPIHLVQSTGEVGVLSLYPIFNPSNVLHIHPLFDPDDPLTRPDLIGFISVVLKMTDFVEAALDDREFGVNLFMIMNETHQEPLHISHETKGRPHRGGFLANNRQIESEIYRTSDIENDTKQDSAYVVLALGLTLSIIIFILFGVLLYYDDKNLRMADRLRESLTEQILLKSEAIKASEIKSVFVANVTHELRTPLNGVIGTLDLLMQDLPSQVLDDFHEDFDQLKSCAQILLALINDVLDFSKLEENKMEFIFESVDLQSIILSSLSTVRSKSETKSIFMGLKCESNDVVTDPIRVGQVLMNFLSNAVKFTPKGGSVIVKASVLQTEDQDHLDYFSDRIEQAYKHTQFDISQWKPGVLEISVTDSGIGIPKSRQHLLFGKFEQLDPSRTRMFGGSGLGLSISKKIANGLCGEIVVVSEEGKGSTFTLILPIYSISTRGFGKVPSIYEVTEKSQPFYASPYSLDEVEFVENEGKDQQDEQKIPQKIPDSEATLPVPIESPKKPKEEGAVSQKPVRRKKKQKWDIPDVDFSILLVEDSITNQTIMKRMLDQPRWTITCADNGLEGVRLSSKIKYDLILMDCQMPVMDGYQACETIKNDPTNPNVGTPMFALTANFESANETRCRHLGMEDFLTKPLRLNDMMIKVIGQVKKKIAQDNIETHLDLF